MTVLANARRLGRILRVLIAHGLSMLLGPRLEAGPGWGGWRGVCRRAISRARSGCASFWRTWAGRSSSSARCWRFSRTSSPSKSAKPIQSARPGGTFPVRGGRADLPGGAGQAAFRDFDQIETEPLATASIGQVHVAYLNGQKLAVQVQRPSVDVEFSGDIRLMSSMLWLIRHLRLRLFYWAVSRLTEFIVWTAEELDYRSEARYMEQLRVTAGQPRRARAQAAAELCQPPHAGGRVLRGGDAPGLPARP